MKSLWQRLSFNQHLLFIIVFKMIILYGFWYAYIKPNKVVVHDSDMLNLYSPSGQKPVLNSGVKP